MSGCQNTCIDKLRTHWLVNIGGKRIWKHSTVKKLRAGTPSGTGIFAIFLGQRLAFILWMELHCHSMKCFAISFIPILLLLQNICKMEPERSLHFASVKGSKNLWGRIFWISVELHLLIPGWNLVPAILFVFLTEVR